jgi:hypothetical protein
MLHSAELQLPAMPHSAESHSVKFKKKINQQLRAMQLNVKFNAKFSGQLCAMQHRAELTLRYAA